VQEPASDAWVQRTPAANEQPVNNQFFARDDTGFGKIYYNGTQSGSPSSVFLKIYTTDTGTDVQYGSTLRQTLVGTSYAFTAPIAAGKVTYKVVYGTTNGSGVDTIVNTVTNLICGDAYIVEGQSNAVADDPGAESPAYSNAWIRTYTTAAGWGNASQAANAWKIGYCGVALAARLLANSNVPICILNGAVGGTRIDQHQPNPANHFDTSGNYSIYGNLLNVVAGAKLTHGIRGVLWHQGEQDQGSGGPDGDYDYKFYQQYFVDMSAAWKQDFPNIRHYYIFQIWPAACGDTSRCDLLRETQRTLPSLYSNMRIMTTVGIVPGSSCHYVPDGYQKFSDLMGPLVEQDNYGYYPASVFTAPDLKKAYYSTSARNEITLEFGQDMAWINASKGLFYLDGVSGKVASGSVAGKIVKLQLTAASTAQKITYLQGLSWDGVQANLLYGANGIAALTFADVALTASSSITLARHAGTGNSTAYGDMLNFDVIVSGTQTPVPTGTVDLKDGGASGTTIGSGTLAGGVCTIATNSLSLGSHANLVAVYSGDSTYASSTSSALSSQTVNKATPTVTVTGTTSFSYNGTAQGPDTATVGGSTGTVTFSYAGTGGTSYGASSTKPTGVGSYTVTATVAADANYNSASSGATAFTIAMGNPVVTITGTTSFTYNGSGQGPATATTGGSTGAVAYSYAGTAGTTYGPASIKPTNAGSYTVTATVAADLNYNSASSSATAFTIAKATPTLAVANSPVIYNGLPQAATVNGSVSGSVSNVKYNGSATVPSAAASYAITADFAPADSTNINSLTGASAGNFVIIPPPATTAGTATATATGQTGITVTMPYTNDGNASNTYTVEYKFSVGGNWTAWVSSAVHTASPYTTTITGLTQGTSYDVRVTYNDADGVVGTNPQTFTVVTGNPGITELNPWTNLYHNTSTSAQSIPYAVPAGTGTFRVLVVAIASSQTGPGARTVTLTYGGQALTPAVNGDMATASVRQHTALFYLNNAGLIAAAANANPTTLAVTVSGGTTRMTDVFAAVYDGVNQTASVADSKTYSSGTTPVSTFAFGTGLAVNAGNQAVGITCSDRSGSTTLRTVSTYATNWALATQQTSTTTDAIRDLVTKRSIPVANVAADTSSTVMNGSSLGSMTALSLAYAKAAPAVLVVNSPATYNGSARAATVNGSVAGTVSNVKYNGSATVPTAAGTYAVTADFAPTDPVNYSALTASSAGNLIIQKATPSVAVANSPVTYNGGAQAATINGSVAGTTSNVRYDGSATVPTAAGTYAVTADFVPVDTANYGSLSGASAGSFVIQKASLTVTATGPGKTYGMALSAGTSTANFTATATMPGETVTSVTLTPDAAGLLATTPAGATYVVTPTSAAGTGGFLATNYNITYAAYSGTVAKANATITLGSLSPTYDGSPKPATATTNPVGRAVNLTYDGSSTAPTAAGSYAVAATVSDPNYTGSANGTLVIGKAAATVTLGNLTATYDGTPKSATATTVPPGRTVNLTYNGSSTAPTAPGSYAVAAIVNDPNYTGTAGGTLVIGKAAATVTLGNLAATYDGTPKSATATTVPTGRTVDLTYDGAPTAPTAPGSYAVVATINDTNYAGTVNGTLIIGKAAATVTLGNLASTYDGTPKSATATTVPTGRTVDLTYDGSPTAPTAAGSYAVAATVNDPNYAGTGNGTLVINKATATVTLGNLTATYDGTPKSATATTVPSGRTVDLTYDGSPTAPTAAGSYAVAATVNDPNYAGTAGGILIISAESIISWSTSHFTQDEITAGLAADTADPDHDGFTNRDEYVFGTDPHVPSTRLLTVSANGANLVLSFFARAATGTGYAGLTRKYDVQSTTDLTDPASWTVVAGHSDIVGDDTTVNATLPVDAAKKFYRLKVRLE